MDHELSIPRQLTDALAFVVELVAPIHKNIRRMIQFNRFGIQLWWLDHFSAKA